MFLAFDDFETAKSMCALNAYAKFTTNPFDSYDFNPNMPLPSFLVNYCCQKQYLQSIEVDIALPSKIAQFTGNCKNVTAKTGTFVQVSSIFFLTVFHCNYAQSVEVSVIFLMGAHTLYGEGSGKNNSILKFT